MGLISKLKLKLRKIITKYSNDEDTPLMVLDVIVMKTRVCWIIEDLGEKLKVRVPTLRDEEKIVVWIEKYNNYYFEDQLPVLDERIQLIKNKQNHG